MMLGIQTMTRTLPDKRQELQQYDERLDRLCAESRRLAERLNAIEQRMGRLEHINGAPLDCRILIVDDDQQVTELLHHMLTSNGYQSEWTDDPAEALKRLSEDRFDVVLLDVVMPGLSGLDIIRLIPPTVRRPYIVAVTGLPVTPGAAPYAGFDALIRKPFEVGLVLQTVRLFCSGSG